MKILRFHLLLLSLLALGSITVQAAQLASAKVLEVNGSVTKFSDSAADTPLKAGDILVEGDGISASHLSSAKLVFSNGSMLTVEENSSVTFAELKQESFSGNKSYDQLEADPSVSQNRLELNYGKVTGHVKKLRAGSDFMVHTPIGTAAIRGTVFSVSLRYNKERNEMILVVENADGLVDIISQFSGDLDFGRGNTADKGFGNSSGENKRQAIPPRHKVVIRISHDHPMYDDIIQALENYPPFQSDGQQPIIITLPGEEDDQPPFTEEDPGVIIISPEV